MGFSRTRHHLLSLLALALLLVCPAKVDAQREHTVRSGQTLSHIAARYHVSVSNLAAANGLRRNSSLQIGQTLRIPERGVVYVREGQTLSHVARAHGVSVADLARVNRLRATSTLQVGQRLVLPGHDSARQASRAAERWGRPRHPGIVTFYRLSNHEKVRVRLVDSRGRARNAARQRLARLLRHRRTNRRRLPNPRLVQLLSRISDHFGGRKIIVISGFRPTGGYTRETSRHVAGRAIDFRISGVPNRVLRDYLRSLPDVGVGFYPRSSFVHLDVRDHSNYWVDWSRPGQAPRYDRHGGRPEDATEEELRRARLAVPETEGDEEEVAAEAENEAEGTPDQGDEDAASDGDASTDDDTASVDDGSDSAGKPEDR